MAAPIAKAPEGEPRSLFELVDGGTEQDLELLLPIGVTENASVPSDGVAPSLPTVFDRLIEPISIASALDTAVSAVELDAQRSMWKGLSDDEPVSAATTAPEAEDIAVAMAESANQIRVALIVPHSAEGEAQADAPRPESSFDTEQPAVEVAVEVLSETVDGPFGDPELSLAEEGFPHTTSDVRPALSQASYRPRLRPRSGDIPSSARRTTRPNREVSALDADLVVFFQPGDWGIALSVLLRRGAGGPEETNVKVGGDAVNVLAIDDAFFEPLPLPDIEDTLRNGIIIETVDTPRRRWIRTRRTLHVFSERPGVSGFVSVPRAVIGQENVILCTDEVSTSVLDFCRTADSEPPVEVAGPGVASGWRCFRGYRPKRPAQEQGAEEILLALSPKPDAAIELSGGISISRGTWITERPPVIRLVGAQPADGELTIDNQPASLADDGWVSADWSAPGRHVIRYAGLSRSYEIVAPEDHWDLWAAHPGSQFSACGAAVSALSGTRSIVLPAAGCWLLGAHPGQTSWATPSVYGSAIAAPSFEPVWAILPRVGRTRTAPRLLASNALPQEPVQGTSPTAMRQWCQLLRNSPPHLAAPEADALWQLYRRAARALKKRRHR